MKAVVVRQPWASLIAHGIKTIETRGFRPTNTIKPGDQFAIVAGKTPPKTSPDPLAECDDGSGWWLGDFLRVCDERPTGEGWWLERWSGTEADFTEPLPLGSVVAVVTFDEALPVVDEDGDLTATEPPCLEHRPLGATNAGLWRWMPAWEWVDEIGYQDLTDQLPLGDFTPGRYGWLLSNPHRLTDPVPCPAIAPDGTKTHMQGVFTLPAHVEQAVTAQLSP